MVIENIDMVGDWGDAFIKVECPQCNKCIELTYPEWENTTKPAKEKRICDCGKEWEIKIVAKANIQTYYPQWFRDMKENRQKHRHEYCKEIFED